MKTLTISGQTAITYSISLARGKPAVELNLQNSKLLYNITSGYFFSNHHQNSRFFHNLVDFPTHQVSERCPCVSHLPIICDQLPDDNTDILIVTAISSSMCTTQILHKPVTDSCSEEYNVVPDTHIECSSIFDTANKYDDLQKHDKKTTPAAVNMEKDPPLRKRQTERRLSIYQLQNGMVQNGLTSHTTHYRSCGRRQSRSDFQINVHTAQRLAVKSMSSQLQQQLYLIGFLMTRGIVC